MKIHFLLLLTLLLPVLASSQKKLVITHVAIIDVTNGHLSRDMNITIEDHRITDITSAPAILKRSKGVEYLDGKDKYLIPGLWDMHVHLSFYGPEALEMLVNNGITGVRDMGGNLQQLDRWRAEIRGGADEDPAY